MFGPRPNIATGLSNTGVDPLRDGFRFIFSPDDLSQAGTAT
jgi:hypothetical protein